nr:hypothetical protein KXZ65_02765 [Pectobacterium sp. PL152]
MLVVDADEVINQFDVALLSELISIHPTQVGTVEIASVTNDESSEEADLIQERISRIFNKNYYEFSVSSMSRSARKILEKRQMDVLIPHYRSCIMVTQKKS